MPIFGTDVQRAAFARSLVPRYWTRDSPVIAKLGMRDLRLHGPCRPSLIKPTEGTTTTIRGEFDQTNQSSSYLDRREELQTQHYSLRMRNTEICQPPT